MSKRDDTRDPFDLERDLWAVSIELEALDRQRAAVLARRDVLVDVMRGRGYAWARLADLARVSVHALQKRRGVAG